MTPLAKLEIVAGEVAALQLYAGTYIVGRHKKCDLSLKDRSVSRQHATLLIAPGSVTIVDHVSRNGTFVDGIRVDDRCVVTTGVTLSFGSVTCLFHWLEEYDDIELSTYNDLARGKLTPAELRVFVLLMSGAAEQAIANKLYLSPHTVHNHIRRIYRVFEVRSRSELFARVQQLKQ